ncbi:MAG: sulfotransferase [Actinomycetota bacterium]|nr:sulfotransferase [Actinomycetota bacterium]
MEPHQPHLPDKSGLKVLYILGSSRSGSTILDSILGELNGYFSAGELRFIWRRLLENRRCGCGQSLEDCEVWSQVLAGVVDQDLRETAKRHYKRQQRNVSTKHTTGLLRRRVGEFGSDELAAYAHATASLYREVAEVTGAKVIVDSSKRISDGALLRLLPGFELYFVHLVRDPRAVAYSRRRTKLNPDREVPGEMGGKNPAGSAFQWAVGNLGADVVRRKHGRSRSMLVRYEDFVKRPRGIVEQITDMVGVTPGFTPFITETSVRLGVHHTVSGNPIRFNTGTVDLVEDNRWRAELSTFDRTVTTSLTLPQMLAYRYPVRLGKRGD